MKHGLFLDKWWRLNFLEEDSNRQEQEGGQEEFREGGLRKWWRKERGSNGPRRGRESGSPRPITPWSHGLF